MSEEFEFMVKNNTKVIEELHHKIQEVKNMIEGTAKFDMIKKEISELTIKFTMFEDRIIPEFNEAIQNIESVLKEYNDLIIETLSSEISGESIDYLIKETNNLFKQIDLDNKKK